MIPPPDRPTTGARQLLLFAAALVAYQAVRGLTAGDAAEAAGNALEVIRLQDSLGIAVEPAVQGWALARVGAGELLSAAYIGLHLPVTAALFVWLWLRRRTAYVPLRNVFLAANALALVVFAVFPVAPPRLVIASGLTDALRTSVGVDLHGGVLSGLFNPYAAVPSMHVAYAALVGVAVWLLADNHLVRLAGALYPALIVLVVVATGNHYVLDAVAGVGMLVGGALAVRVAGLPWRPPPASLVRPHRPDPAR